MASTPKPAGAGCLSRPPMPCSAFGIFCFRSIRRGAIRFFYLCCGVPVYQFHPICTGYSPEWHDWQAITAEAAALESRPIHWLFSTTTTPARVIFVDKAGNGWLKPLNKAPVKAFKLPKNSTILLARHDEHAPVTDHPPHPPEPAP